MPTSRNLQNGYHKYVGNRRKEMFTHQSASLHHNSCRIDFGSVRNELMRMLNAAKQLTAAHPEDFQKIALVGFLQMLQIWSDAT